MDEITPPAGSIPVDQFEALPPAHPDDHAASQIPGAIPIDQFESQEEKYGTTGQQILTGVEAAGRGMLGPIATGIEKGLGVPKEDILARQRENPIISGTGEAAGLGAGMFTGTGEAALMSKAGEGALELAGLANVAKDANLMTKVGASAVQQAAEMAVLSGADETSKLLLNDPEASTESAIANIGMAAALGGAGGAFLTGAVSPLWSATAGPKVESLLNGIKEHLNGVAAIIPEETGAAMSKLGIDTAPEIRAGLSGNPAAVERFNVLKEVQKREIIEGVDKLHKDISDSVMSSMGITPESVEVYSENKAGHDLLDTFKQEYNEKYEPIAQKMEQRKVMSAPLPVPDEARLKVYGNMLETGMQKMGTDSPYYKLYEEYGNRVLAKDTIGQLDSLKTEINNRIKGLKIGGDYNIINSLNDIKSMIGDFQEKHIVDAARLNDAKALARNERMGLKGIDKSATEESSKLLNARAEANRSYSEFAKMSDELTNHLGVGDFKGAGTLSSKLTDKLSPEQLMRKFSIRNNADFIKFLGEHFPETLKRVQENELKQILKPSILNAKGETSINVKKLSDLISKGMAGQKEYIESVVPKQALERIEAAKTVMNALPNPKSSGTAGWLSKLTAHVPQSALAAVAMLAGHNPVFGYLAGEMAHRLGRTAPDAINLAYLKFLGSNQPVKSEAFKAMVDMFHNTYKGNNMVTKAISNVFEAGTKVLVSSQMPSKADTEKLDKIVTKMQDAPNKIFALQNGHLGHYLPDHQSAATEVSSRALQYLQSIKPQPQSTGPLDKPIPPSKAEQARYQRALDIAQQPAIIMQHVKDGTIQASDMKDLGAMYPGLYKTMASKLSNEMINRKSEDTQIPYKTRIGMSLFLGQPLDTSMTPTSIQAAQLTHLPKTPQASQQAPKKKGTSALGKAEKDYRTPLQASEAQDSTRK